MAIAIDICIPIYDESVRDLLVVLWNQQKQISNATIKVYLIDDASPDLVLREKNESSAKEFEAVYVQQQNNLGRSKTRNAFLKYSQAEWLLFLDGDSMPAGPDFLEHYLEYIRSSSHSGLIYGGTKYNSEIKDNHRLHYSYAIDREALPVNQRIKNPAGSFHANNFLVHRDVLESYPFEERLTHYGHEDSLFAIRLAEKNIAIQHIDNPVLHLGLDDNYRFLEKTQQAVRHLAHIHFCLPPHVLRKYSSLWKWYERCKLFYPRALSTLWIERWMQKQEQQMRAGKYRSKYFALYKLLYLLHLDPLSKMHRNSIT